VTSTAAVPLPRSPPRGTRPERSHVGKEHVTDRAVLYTIKVSNPERGVPKQWDVFISHASEDKEFVARPLAGLLRDAGLRVWLDESELKLGDSLRRGIDQGLAGCRFGVVILSASFFAKEWPQRELDALFARAAEGPKIILPVWHGIDRQFVATYSPILADRLAVSTERGIEVVALAIIGVIRDQFADAQTDDAETLSETTFSRMKRLRGALLNGYRVGELLGSGGSGMVFHARRERGGGDVALKVFYPLVGSSTLASEVLARGFQALAALRHPNIVRVFDFDSVEVLSKRFSYLIMEYIQGFSGDAWSQKLEGRPNSLELRLDAALQMTEGLQAAHSTVYIDRVGFEVRGVLHGDLKPSNVLIDSSGHVKLVDFLLIDVHRLLNPAVVRDRHGTFGHSTAIGTPGFMAPEQERDGIASVKTDIFGLGMTFAHLFLPGTKFPLDAMLHSPKTPATLKALLEEMCSETPEQRPCDVDSVLTRLREVKQRRFDWRRQSS
jgi:Protein kinase domain/TIR domain